MPRKRTAPKSRRAAPTQADSVDGFLAALDHPLKSALALIRSAILGASPRVEEGIKWNAPSFRAGEWFATVNIHPKAGLDSVLVVLHLGAKARGVVVPRPAIPDPEGLLEWLGKDRAVVRLRSLKEARAAKAPLQAIVRAWITHR